jgi:protein HOOK3
MRASAPRLPPETLSDRDPTQVNTFDLAGRVNAWNQLEDGQTLWQILADIDPDYFNESLPNLDEGTDRRRSIADNWIPKWQNLKHIERQVSIYIREECNQLPVLTKRMIPDLKTGARDGSLQLTAKLTMAILFAAYTSPKSGQRMLVHMGQLNTEKQGVIAGGIQELQSLDERMADLGVEQELTAEPPLTTSLSGYRTPTRAVSGAGSALGKDSELEQEALLFEANKDRTTLRTQVTKLQEEVTKSKGRISQLEEELVEARLHLDDSGAGGATSDEVERLRDDLRRERQYIDRLETDHAHAKDVIDSLKKRMNRLEGDYDAKQELKDQLQLVKAERDELERKAKANENLKKKIESLSKEAKALETARQELQQARERLQDLEDIEEKCAALEKVNRENIQTLVNSEQSIFEEKGRRTRLEHENIVLMKQVEQTKELQYKAEDKNRDLEDRLRDFEANGPRGGSLEDELNHDGTETTDDILNTKTPLDGRVSADAIALQQRVDVLSARLKSMETETLKQMQENLGLKSDILASKDEESQR